MAIKDIDVPKPSGTTTIKKKAIEASKNSKSEMTPEEIAEAKAKAAARKKAKDAKKAAIAAKKAGRKNSPATKPLKGKQKNLPEALQEKIIASPATKRANLGEKPKKMRTSNMSKASLILNTPKDVFKPIVAKTDYDYKFEKEGPMPNMAAQMKNKAMTADAKAAQMKFDSSTFKGIESLYTGGRVGGEVGQESQKSNTAPDLMRDVNRIKQRVKPSNFHTSGSPEFLTSTESGERINTTTGGIDEGNFGPITTNIPEKSKVTAIEGSANYEPGEEFYINPTKMSGKHPSQMRMGSMVQKVATYKMPNVKAAQKKNYKY
tara:strand:+ start:327 stop:1283 length:957 start_codon:yes stop_codon:yes gene_type:complete